VAGLATTFGSGAMTNTIGEISDASCLLVVGSNTTDAHPIIGLQVRKAVRQNGAKLIVINPREIDLCRLADLWLRLLPGTDVALLNGMAHVILREGLADTTFVEERTEGFDEWRQAVEVYTPALVSRITGVDEEQITLAARMYATAGGRPGGASSILYTMGITQHTTGTDNVKGIANLAMVTGNVGKPSSGVNPLRGQSNVQGACDMGCLPDVYTGYQKVSLANARAKFEDSWGCVLPSDPGKTMPEMVDAIEAGQIKAMYIMGENPLVSDPDINHLREVIGKLEFLVVQDVFLTETARLADVVLPGASFAEKDGTFTNTERRVQRVRKAIAPVGKAKADWEILEEVARRTARKIGGAVAKVAEGFEHSGPSGIMVEIAGVTPSYAGIRFELIEGGGLQWPVPSLGHPGTSILHVGQFARGKGLFSPVAYLPPAELPDDEYPIVLTTGRSLFHYHTGSLTRRVKGLSFLVDREYLQIHPDDAARLGLADGDLAKVSSRRGEIEATVAVTSRVMPGVVYLDFHFSESPANALTNPAVDPVAKIAELKVCAVKVEKAVSSVPPDGALSREEVLATSAVGLAAGETPQTVGIAGVEKA
jgi:formate dehydrogenase alpha subunit